MREAREVFKEMADLAARAFALNKREKIAKLYEEYLKCPGVDPDVVYLSFSGKVVPRSEVPRLLREDDKFYEAFLEDLRKMREKGLV